MKRPSSRGGGLSDAIGKGIVIPGVLAKAPSPKRSKYGNVPTVYNGMRYVSKAEADRAKYHDAGVKVGAILWWYGQPKFRLGVIENVYIADFLVVGLHGTHVEDVKGVRTPKFQRDVKLWRAYGPCPLHIVSGRKVEIVEPKRGDGWRQWRADDSA